MGLLVSISDVKLPAETGVRADRLGHPIGGNAVFLQMVLRIKMSPTWPTCLHRCMFPKASRSCCRTTGSSTRPPAATMSMQSSSLAIIMAESQLNPRAKSKKGARGLMQIMPVTADALDVANIFNPEENINAGTRHFRGLLDRFDGDVQLALAAYNAGEQNVLRYNGIPPLS